MRESHGIFLENKGPQDSETARSANLLGECLLRRGAFGEAEQHLVVNLARLQEAAPPDADLMAETSSAGV